MSEDNQPANPAPAAPNVTNLSTLPTGLAAQVWQELRQCYDPEIPLNIVDLGLVYQVDCEQGRVTVKMTLTSPGCHLGGQIAANVQERILGLEDAEEAAVELVWDPPWHPGLISPEGRRRLGLDEN
jgi:metal-sulfur cluster biosynthetic enzyme